MSYKQKLLDLINEDNGTSFTLEQLRFSQPVVVSTGEGNNRNTKVTVYGVEAEGYGGHFPFTFERLDLARLFVGRTAVAEVQGSNFSLAEIITSLAERFSITLYADDFTSPDLGPDSSTVTIVPNANSYYWLSTPLVVEITNKMTDISTTLPHVILPGFEYPTITVE